MSHLLMCRTRIIIFPSPSLDKEWKRNPSGLSDGFGLSTVACLAHVKACSGEVNIVLNCTHCPDGEPFTDQEALRKHIKRDHELQQLLYSEAEVAFLKKKLDHELQPLLLGEVKVASQKDNMKTFTGSSEVTSQDGTGDSYGSSSSSYHTANEGE